MFKYDDDINGVCGMPYGREPVDEHAAACTAGSEIIVVFM